MHVRENLPSESFEQLAMPHFERLYNLACWLTHDRQEAEDLVQETYAKALKGFSSFRPGTNFRAWNLQDFAECIPDLPYRAEDDRFGAARS